LIDTVLPLKGTVARVYLPPDANCLLSVADHCLRSRNYANLIVIDKQPQLQYLDLEAAREHCALGMSTWDWASNEGDDPDVVMCSAGDIPTMEALAATALLRERLPHLRVRFVNIVDLMALYPADVHPHGMPEGPFVELFCDDEPVVMAFHGYARAVHQLVHGRTHAERFHVQGFSEEGTTTTPFDMVVLNEMSRYHLALQALKRSKRAVQGAGAVASYCRDMLRRHHAYVSEHFDDMPEVKDWVWPG
jgi:xylulose-5-phosphate/fructose-6-phosphate phosphoketolase